MKIRLVGALLCGAVLVLAISTDLAQAKDAAKSSKSNTSDLTRAKITENDSPRPQDRGRVSTGTRGGAHRAGTIQNGGAIPDIDLRNRR